MMIKSVVVSDSKKLTMLEVFSAIVDIQVKNGNVAANEFWDGIKNGTVEISIGNNCGVFDENGNSIPIVEDMLRMILNTYKIRKIA